MHFSKYGKEDAEVLKSEQRHLPMTTLYSAYKPPTA